LLTEGCLLSGRSRSHLVGRRVFLTSDTSAITESVLRGLTVLHSLSADHCSELFVYIAVMAGASYSPAPPPNGLLCGDGIVNEVEMCRSQYYFLVNFIYNKHNQNIMLCSLYEA
jgi:hypothetical protein